MGIAAGLAIFAIIWWLVLFAVLPFGVETRSDTEKNETASASGFPLQPNIGKKVLATTIIAACVWGIVFWLIVFSGFALEDIPFLPTF